MFPSPYRKKHGHPDRTPPAPGFAPHLSRPGTVRPPGMPPIMLVPPTTPGVPAPILINDPNLGPATGVGQKAPGNMAAIINGLMAARQMHGRMGPQHGVLTPNSPISERLKQLMMFLRP